MDNRRRVFDATALETGCQVGLGAGPCRILLLGAPGVGKGTQAREMEKSWGIPHISTGDLLRDHVNRDTSLGREAREIMRRGEFVPDSLVCEIVATRLQQPDTFRGYILDGFPRTLEQATWLDGCLATQGCGHSLVSISIHMDYKQLLRRITGRRTCPDCRAIYNVYLNPPKQDGLCNVENAVLVQRIDDTKQVFEERLRAYEMMAAPVVEHYRALGRLVEVDGDRPIGEIAAEIVVEVNRLSR